MSLAYIFLPETATIAAIDGDSGAVIWSKVLREILDCVGKCVKPYVVPVSLFELIQKDSLTILPKVDARVNSFEVLQVTVNLLTAYPEKFSSDDWDLRFRLVVSAWDKLDGTLIWNNSVVLMRSSSQEDANFLGKAFLVNTK